MIEKHILEDKTIFQVEITTDKEAIKFITDKGEVVAITEADCCSQTWINDIELPVFGLPAKVISVENLRLAEDNWEEGELIRFYGCKITTDKGEILIDFRNSSNGYYGGSLLWLESIIEDKDYYTYCTAGPRQSIPDKDWENVK